MPPCSKKSLREVKGKKKIQIQKQIVPHLVHTHPQHTRADHRSMWKPFGKIFQVLVIAFPELGCWFTAKDSVEAHRSLLPYDPGWVCSTLKSVTEAPSQGTQHVSWLNKIVADSCLKVRVGYSIKSKSRSSGVSLSVWVWIWPHLWPVTWPWTSCLTSLCLTCVISENGIIISTLWVCCVD